jgi:hypothetical protein
VHIEHNICRMVKLLMCEPLLIVCRAATKALTCVVRFNLVEAVVE